MLPSVSRHLLKEKKRILSAVEEWLREEEEGIEGQMGGWTTG